MTILHLILVVYALQACLGQEEPTAVDGTFPLHCLEPVDAGPCKALKIRFFYNVTSGQCESFNYGGCDGTPNRFDELALCQSTCRAGVCTAVSCLMECASGFETDGSGCKVCSCRSLATSTPANETVRGCPLIKCPACPPGEEYVKDAKGCDTCQCIQPTIEPTEAPKADCPPNPICNIFCPGGQEKDSKGCPICKCIDTVELTTNCTIEPSCAIYCPGGQAKDSTGCPICKCIDTVEPATNCSLVPNCKIFCPNGQQKDNNGCPICKCIDTVEPATNCSLVPNCKIFCANGQQKDVNGCPLCKCIESDCPALVACRIFCPDGQAKDSRGCPICQCVDAKPTGKCPPLQVTCTMACEFGFAKNANGCQICECQQNSCDLIECGEEERCRTENNELGFPVAKCKPGRRWCFEGICHMYCENGFKSDQLGCPTCSCLDHTLDKCRDVSWCKQPCEFGHQRDEHGCRMCECLPNPCKDYECIEGTVCEALFFRGCPNCPAVAKCIEKSDVKRLYVMLTYTHGRVRNLDQEKFALLVAKTISEAVGLDSSAVFNMSLTPATLKTLVTFHLIARHIDLVSTAKKLEWVLDSDLSVVTFDLSGVTFLPDRVTLTIMYYSNDDVEVTQPEAVESSNDDKVIIVAVLVGITFFVICVIIMTVLYRRRRRREKANIIYKKAPTKEEPATLEAKM